MRESSWQVCTTLELVPVYGFKAHSDFVRTGPYGTVRYRAGPYGTVRDRAHPRGPVRIQEQIVATLNDNHLVPCLLIAIFGVTHGPDGLVRLSAFHPEKQRVPSPAGVIKLQLLII